MFESSPLKRPSLFFGSNIGPCAAHLQTLHIKLQIHGADTLVGNHLLYKNGLHFTSRFTAMFLY